MAMLSPAYHFALVVEDIDRAMAELSTVLRLDWAKLQERAVTIEGPDGTAVPLDMRYTYSLQGPPYFELIERREGTVFDKTGLHHIGVWCDDVPTESRRLENLGWPRETVALKPDGSWGGGLYHHGCDGLRLEVVDIAASGPKLARYLAGGDYA